MPKEKLTNTLNQLQFTKRSFESATNKLSQNAAEVISSPEFDNKLQAQKVELEAKQEKIKSIMNSLQRRAWSSLRGDKEIVYMLSHQEGKTKTNCCRRSIAVN